MNEERKRVLCVGMCVLDIIHSCEKFPVEDTDQRCLSGHWQRGGNASNNCTVLRQLNAECEFLGVLSNSRAFQFLEEDCRNRQIHFENCPKVDQDPPFSSVILNNATNSRTIIHSNSNFPILRFCDFDKISLKRYQWIHFEARNPEETSRMISKIKEHNRKNVDETIKISIELEKIREENFALVNMDVDVVFLGKDLAQHCGWNNLEAAAWGLRKKTGKRFTIICTWGSLGSAILDENNIYTYVPSYPPEYVVDTLGAGDTFCAATVFALCKKKSSKDAVEFASRLTGRKLSFYGYDDIGLVFDAVWSSVKLQMEV